MYGQTDGLRLWNLSYGVIQSTRISRKPEPTSSLATEKETATEQNHVSANIFCETAAGSLSVLKSETCPSCLASTGLLCHSMKVLSSC